MKTALLIMAAGIGSRFGTGIKQLAKVDDGGHIIMDYSIHDAIEAGFNKIVFIIRKDIEAEFREVIGDRIERVCAAHGVEVAYAFQSLQDIPEGFTVPEGRTKPWGTGQAVLAAKELVDCPFAVINADDYYGKQAYKDVHDYLCEGHADYCMAGFVLRNTLSEHGGVTRGVCTLADGYLTGVCETPNIVKTADGAEAEGKVLDADSLVSMNFWGFTPAFLTELGAGFRAFFEAGVGLKSEYLIPVYIGERLAAGKTAVRVLRTPDTWYGMTYHEDVAAVTESFRKLLDAGVYSADLFGDLN